MAFPLSPANNQTALVNGIVYQWNAALGVWKRNGSINSASIGQLVLTSAQTSTSNVSGTLIVSGGAGITGNLYTGGIYITGANGITFPDGTVQTTAGGLTSANTRLTIIEGVDVGQNTRMSIIEGVDATQNASISILQGVDLTQNTNITAADTKAQGAFDKANSANVLAQAAFDAANTASGAGSSDSFARQTANAAFTQANTATTLAQAAFDKANTSSAVLTSTVDTFTGDGSNTAFTLSTTPATINYTTAVVGGVTQPRSAYSVVGTTLTFTSAPANNQTIEVTTIGTSNTTLYTVNNIISPFLLMGA